ncbi:phosphatidylglycerol lysyltransferase domain-containing protein [Clostridia bacterium OttesenSCG-928-F22]|nr:phosphatidylglycerol lysyltransferase domain-containing protein [Clostridia bacterium OttesenSCG-928-F22]
MEFQPLELSHKALVDKYLAVWQFEGAEWAFSNMFIWRHKNKPMICEMDGILYIHVELNGHRCFMAPLSLDREEDYCPAMTRVEKYMKEQGWAVDIRMINDTLRERIEKCIPGRFAFSENRDYEDYIYDAEELRTLQGRKLHGKRNHINKFMAMYGNNFEYAPMQQQDVAECLALYETWIENKGGDLTEYEDERISLTQALTNLEALGLKGCVVRINGKIEGFSVGAQLNDKTAVIHIEKGNDTIQGIFPVVNQLFVKNQWKDCEFINREEDMGIPGLRRAKMSYNPVRLVRKFTARSSEI